MRKRKKGRPPMGPNDRVHRGRNRDAQVVRYTRRKLFNKERRAIFLEWFAATANMSWAAEVAGVSYKTVSKHILKDAEFAAEVEAAMQMGVLRAKARLLETPKQETPLDADGEADAPPPDMSLDQAERAIREHGRTLHYGRKPGRVPRIASNEEVLKAVAKGLAALAKRVARRESVLRDGPSPGPHESSTFVGTPSGSVLPQDERGLK